ncbi:hypothetical protein EDF39_1393 [Frondihabitans sp. PhB161]|nr:hypothetical protein EDF37_1391 [Frondihabitans sp. PhB153]RPF08991.1 hypothetical protein EDF39_1393 [Frondihabitans sp. PhB161]
MGWEPGSGILRLVGPMFLTDEPVRARRASQVLRVRGQAELRRRSAGRAQGSGLGARPLRRVAKGSHPRGQMPELRPRIGDDPTARPAREP